MLDTLERCEWYVSSRGQNPESLPSLRYCFVGDAPKREKFQVRLLIGCTSRNIANYNTRSAETILARPLFGGNCDFSFTQKLLIKLSEEAKLPRAFSY